MFQNVSHARENKRKRVYIPLIACCYLNKVYCDENCAFIQSVHLFVCGWFFSLYKMCRYALFFCNVYTPTFDIYSGVISNSLFTSEVVDILFELFFYFAFI